MATAFLLEDHICCSVCLEVYTKPYSLSCLHTFCHQCILQLQIRTIINCPECREPTAINKIKKDFKTQTFLDWHFKQKEASTGNKSDSQVKILSKCELCNNELRSIHSKCINCNQYLCSECVNLHKLITVCKHHTLQPVADIIQSIHTKLKENIQSFEKEKKYVLKTLKGISDRIQDVQERKLKQLADVKKYKEKIFTEIDEYCKDLNRKIVEVNEELIQNLTDCDSHFNKALKEIRGKIDTLSRITETQGISFISQQASTASSINIEFEVQKEIKEIKKKLPQVNTEVKSPVGVNKHVEWNVSKTVSVTIDGVVYLNPNFTSKAEGPLFTEMLKHKYKQTKEIKLSSSSLQRLHLINDDLWIAEDEGIHIYNKDCQNIREINDPRIENATGVVQAHNGDIIVSSSEYYNTNQNRGLHKIHKNGIYIEKIVTGDFSDVAAFKNKIYALEYKLNKIIIYEESNKKWTQVRVIPVIFTNGKHYDKLCVKDTGIYVTSFEIDCLYYHNLDGEYVYKTGQRGDKAPGNFEFPRICDVDELGNVLVADTGHDCLQLYSADWQIVDIPVRLPRDAVVDQHASNIWAMVGNIFGGGLIKFTKV